MLAKLRRSLLLSPGHNLQISAIFLCSLLLPHLTSGKRISKCCPLGQLLSPSGHCIPMMSGTALPKIRVKDSEGASELVSFKWLKDQKMLKEDARPRCEITQEIIPDFSQSVEIVPYFSYDGVFVEEMKFHRPGTYCVDGVEDIAASAINQEQKSYIMLMSCGHKSEDMKSCSDVVSSDSSCYSRCCDPWQTFHHDSNQDDKCVYTKSKHLERFRERFEDDIHLETRIPFCDDLRPSEEYELYDEGSMLVDGRILTSNNYCVSGPLLWFCEAAFNSSEAVRLDLEYYEYQEGSISSADRNVRHGILTLLIFKFSLSLLWTNSVVV